MTEINNNTIYTTIKKYEKIDFTFIVFLIAVFTFNLGELIYIGPLKLSWVSSIFIVLLLPFKSNNSIKFLYKCCFLMIWLLYAVFQLLIIGEIITFATSLLSLFINIFVVFISFIFITDVRKLYYAILTVLLSILLNAFIGAYEYITLSSIMPRIEDKWIGLPMSIYGNPNDFGTFMVLGVYLVLLLNKFKKVNKLLLFSAIIIFSIMAYLSSSRLCVISLIILLIAYFINKYVLTIQTKKMKQILTGLVVTVLILGLLVSAYYPTIITPVLRLLGNQSDLVSDIYRLEILKYSFDNFFRSFFIGTGAGTSAVIINPHNLFIEILSEYGIIWFVFVVAVLVSINQYQYQKRATGNIVSAMLISFIFLSMVSSSAFKMRPIWLFIIFLYLNMKFEQKNTINNSTEMRNIQW